MCDVEHSSLHGAGSCMLMYTHLKMYMYAGLLNISVIFQYTLRKLFFPENPMVGW